MSTKTNLSQNPIACNGQCSLEALASLITDSSHPNLTQLWSLRASEAIQNLIEFRSAVHRWQAQGRISDKEFMAEMQRLAEAGLSDWADDLISLAAIGLFGGQ